MGQQELEKKTVRRFAEEGANVFFMGRREAEGKAFEEELLRQGKNVTYFKSDVTC